MFAHILTAILVGLGAAVPIGPVNLEIMRRGLRFGFKAAFLTGLGAATVDGIYSILFTLGLSTVPSGPFRQGLSLAGGLVLMTLGALTLRSAFQPLSDKGVGEGADSAERLKAGAVKAKGVGSGYWVGLTMTALNPMTLTFWASLGAVVQGLDLSGLGQRALFAAGVIAGALSWVIAFSFFLHRTRHRISPRFERWATVGGGLALLGFGIHALRLW